MEAAAVAERLKAGAPTWVTLKEAAGEDAFVCEARLPLRDGTDSVYRLRVVVGAAGKPVRVLEEEPRRLPRYCPDRHLWDDGGFCLGLPAEYPSRPNTTHEVAAWWERLRGFLLLQDDVTYTRSWPATCAWPHSTEMIVADLHLQMFAWSVGLPHDVLLRWSNDASRVRRGGLRAPGRRSSCPCGSGRQIRHCHELALNWFDAGRAVRADLEKRFWASQRGFACCGTLARCPLRDEREKETMG